MTYKEFLAEEEARERAEQIERERPAREAAERLNETAVQLGELYRQRLRGEVPDPDLFLDERVGPSVRMTATQAEKFNEAEARRFQQNNPDVAFRENVPLLGAYFEKNNVVLVSEAVIAAWVSRARDYGVLIEREPEPEPSPEPSPDPEPEPAPAPSPVMHEGRDLQTGLPRSYTQFEVDKMSSEEFRRVFKLRCDDLVLCKKSW